MSAQPEPPALLPHDIADLALADRGKQRMDAAFLEMPVLQRVLKRFQKERPLAGWRIAGCFTVGAESANLARVLAAGGAEVALCGDDPRTTQDDVAAALVRHFSVAARAVAGASAAQQAAAVAATASIGPQLVVDSAGVLATELHGEPHRLQGVVGATEDTRTGLWLLKRMALGKILRLPVIAVAEARSKRLFEQQHAVGQATLAAVTRAARMLLAGKTVSVVGYGRRGRGVANHARGLGAQAIVSEVDPLRALAATLDGFRVLPLVDAVQCSDVVVTATGDKHVLDELHFRLMKDRCVLANAGDSVEEINLAALEGLSLVHDDESLVEYEKTDGKRVRLLAGGYSVHHVSADHRVPAAVDVGLAGHALALRFLAERSEPLEAGLHGMPDILDREVARLRLNASGVAIDTLTPEQERYLRGQAGGAEP